MRRLLTFLTIALTVATVAFAQERMLAREVTPLRNLADSEVNDFTYCSDVSQGETMTVTLHGDSLLSESTPRYRQWFVVRGDTLLYAGGENIPRITTPCNMGASFIFPLAEGVTAYVADFRERGRRYASFRIEDTGSYRAEVVGERRLILAPGDTVRHALLTREHLRAAEEFVTGEPTPRDSMEHFSRTVYRWYESPGDRLPVALQTEYFDLTPQGEIATSSIHAYLPDHGERSSRSEGGTDPADAVAGALAAIEAEVGDGSVTVTVPLPQGTEAVVTLDIVDAAGNLYLHTVHTLCGPSTATLDTSALSPRDYILAAGSPSASGALEKRYIRVR